LNARFKTTSDRSVPQERDERLAERAGNRRAQRRANGRQQRALGQQLTDHPPSRGADREAHGNFALTRAGAREHQVGEIRGRDEQHDSCDPQQNQQRIGILFPQLRDAMSRRLRHQRECLVARHALRRIVRRHRLEEAGGERREVRGRRLHRRSRPEPTHHRHVPGRSAVENGLVVDAEGANRHGNVE
jgi:hypothetical protein